MSRTHSLRQGVRSVAGMALSLSIARVVSAADPGGTPGPVLRDIHLPGEPSWWPPAPGWWVLAALALVALAWAARGLARKRHAQRLRRALHAELDRALAASADAAARVAAMSVLLRRAAKHYAPQALTLRDEVWLRWLDHDDAAQPFSRGAGRLLLDGPYRRHLDAEDADALAAVVRARLDAFVHEPRLFGTRAHA